MSIILFDLIYLLQVRTVEAHKCPLEIIGFAQGSIVLVVASFNHSLQALGLRFNSVNMSVLILMWSHYVVNVSTHELVAS